VSTSSKNWETRNANNQRPKKNKIVNKLVSSTGLKVSDLLLMADSHPECISVAKLRMTSI